MPYANRTWRLCVDRVSGGQIAGRLVSAQLAAPYPFSDLGRLLLHVDRLLDQIGVPQAFQRARRFTPPPLPPPEEELPLLTPSQVERYAGQVATCAFLVLSRRSSSWQGTIDWLDGTAPQPYDSALELIRLLSARFG